MRAAAAGFGLLLWDAYRPQRAVDRFLEWSVQPEDQRTKAEFYPYIDRAEMFRRGYVAPKSGHSRGSAVDLTLYRLDTGELAAMGGRHDLMDERSHHGAPGVSVTAARNRQTLCSIMERSGFERYGCEWWRYGRATSRTPTPTSTSPSCRCQRCDSVRVKPPASCTDPVRALGPLGPGDVVLVKDHRWPGCNALHSGSPRALRSWPVPPRSCIVSSGVDPAPHSFGLVR